jgi:hypothetical protein
MIGSTLEYDYKEHGMPPLIAVYRKIFKYLFPSAPEETIPRDATFSLPADVDGCKNLLSITDTDLQLLKDKDCFFTGFKIFATLAYFAHCGLHKKQWKSYYHVYDALNCFVHYNSTVDLQSDNGTDDGSVVTDFANNIPQDLLKRIQNRFGDSSHFSTTNNLIQGGFHSLEDPQKTKGLPKNLIEATKIYDKKFQQFIDT